MSLRIRPLPHHLNRKLHKKSRTDVTTVTTETNVMTQAPTLIRRFSFVSARPRSASNPTSNRWPPSKGGMGSKLKSAIKTDPRTRNAGRPYTTSYSGINGRMLLRKRIMSQTKQAKHKLKAGPPRRTIARSLGEVSHKVRNLFPRSVCPPSGSRNLQAPQISKGAKVQRTPLRSVKPIISGPRPIVTPDTSMSKNRATNRCPNS